MKSPYCFSLLAVALVLAAPSVLTAATPAIPDWAQPGSPTHQQVPPPADFHRATKTFETTIGMFQGQSDIGGPVIPGSSSYDPKTHQYTLDSASYNIWYTRDELRYLWKKMSGDVSLVADIVYPNPNGYDDRKAVLMIRQDLDDDSKEAMTALHGTGLIHLAERPEKSANIKEACRIEAPKLAAGAPAKSGANTKPMRLGIEKRGDLFTLWVSLDGEPMHQSGPTMHLHLDGPFYVGIGFCSHVPDKSDTAVLSHVVLKNSAGKIQ